MATTFSFTVSVEAKDIKKADRVLLEAHKIVSKLEAELSEFLPTSAVAQLNNSKLGQKILAPASLLELLEESQKISTRTEGAFSCLAKSKHREATNNWIATDKLSSTVWKQNIAAHLGFGAIGKGYALDKVRTLIEQAGFANYVLNAGGSSIILSGFSAPEAPWRWGWSWRKDSVGGYEGMEFFHHSGEPIALGISGLQEQGKHLIDPRTGLPAIGLRSAFVGHSSAAHADALSTALFILGWQEGFGQVIDPLLEPACAVIDLDEIPNWNGKFQKLWGAPLVCE